VVEHNYPRDQDHRGYTEMSIKRDLSILMGRDRFEHEKGAKHPSYATVAYILAPLLIARRVNICITVSGNGLTCEDPKKIRI
jgi:hypothetical protein